jgi:hypothetical protein
MHVNYFFEPRKISSDFKNNNGLNTTLNVLCNGIIFVLQIEYCVGSHRKKKEWRGSVQKIISLPFFSLGNI